VGVCLRVVWWVCLGLLWVLLVSVGFFLGALRLSFLYFLCNRIVPLINLRFFNIYNITYKIYIYISLLILFWCSI
jgi:hypothetical protein